MTNEQINAAIAEAINADPHWKCAKDYCADLNAMHDVEGKQSWGTICKIDAYLKQMFGSITLRCTARQRAEAFLRTLGKWEDGE